MSETSNAVVPSPAGPPASLAAGLAAGLPARSPATWPATWPAASGVIEAEVCVVGAGPVGGTLACRLAADGIRTAVVDRGALPPMEHPDFDGRAYAIAAGSRRLLQAAGVWDRLPETPCPIRDIRVSDGRLGQRASPLRLHFDFSDVAGAGGAEATGADAGAAGAEAGAFGWMVEARRCRVR